MTRQTEHALASLQCAGSALWPVKVMFYMTLQTANAVTSLQCAGSSERAQFDNSLVSRAFTRHGKLSTLLSACSRQMV